MVARMAADMAGSADIRIEYLAEAIYFGVWIGRDRRDLRDTIDDLRFKIDGGPPL